MVIFVRFRPLTPNQKEQQPVLTSKPKTGSASASRSSKKSLKEDGEQFSTLNFACCGVLRLPFVCLIFDCSQKKSFCSLSFHLSEVMLSHIVLSLLHWPFCCCAWIQAVLCWAVLRNCFGDFVLAITTLRGKLGPRQCTQNNLISQFDTSPFQPFAHSLKGSMALFGPSRSLVQCLYRVCACEHDTFTYLLFPLIDSENDVSMSQLLSACEPQSFSKFNNKCQRVESI